MVKAVSTGSVPGVICFRPPNWRNVESTVIYWITGTFL